MQFTVTLTGADDGTNPEAMIELSRKYPFVEWGILVGSKSGIDRYPSPFWFELMRECVNGERTAKVRMAMHVCGSPLRVAMSHGVLHLPRETFETIPLFDRFQFNINGMRIPDQNAGLPGLAILSQGTLVGKEIIIQLDGTKDWILHDLFLAKVNVSGLTDKSGGRGETPPAWPAAIEGFKIGYAGGLGPHNIADELPAIYKAANDPFWIDMESKIRTRGPVLLQEDDTNVTEAAAGTREVFDLEKCERVLAAAQAFMEAVSKRE